MINLFNIASNDQSIFFLGKIFGTMGDVLTPGGSTATSIGLLGTMFKTFNSIVLAVAALIVMYTVIVGLLATAHEGEFLGKKFHGLWTPIRTVLGIAALVPTATGYCALQIVLMWVIVQGVGAADTVWNTALKYVQATGSAYAQPQVVDVGVKENLKIAFQGLVCAATTGVKDGVMQGAPSGFGGYYCSQNNCTAAGSNASLISNQCSGDKCTMSFGPGGYCGTLQYCNPAGSSCTEANSRACNACKAQAMVLTGSEQPIQGNDMPTTSFSEASIIGTLNKIAVHFAAADADYVKFYYSSSANATNNGNGWGWVEGFCTGANLSPCCNPPTTAFGMFGMCTNKAGANAFPEPFTMASQPTDASTAEIQKVILPYYLNDKTGGVDFIEATGGNYSAALAASLIQTIEDTQLTGFYDEANSVGWIYAGAYYYKIAQQNDKNAQGANPLFTANGSPSSTALKNYRNNFSAAGELLSSIGSDASVGTDATPQLTAIKSLLKSGNGSILHSFMKTVSGTKVGEMATDPLVSIQSLGKGILITIFIIFPIVIALQIMAGIAAMATSITALGTGMPAGMQSVVTVMSFTITPILLGFMSVFMGIGGLLAVYTPLIPYIIFIVGVIGWFGSTIEAMVAAPLVALGILSPGGQHELLGKAEPALMLIFNIFLRPTLMIFGLMAGMLLASVAVTIVNATFSSVMSSIVGKGSADFISLIFFMVAYVMLILTVLNKCFAMIYIIPTRTMRWIGGQGDDYGEGDAMGEVKGAVGGAAGQAAGAAAGAAQLSKEGPKSRGDHGKAANEKERADSEKAEMTAKKASDANKSMADLANKNDKKPPSPEGKS